MTVTRRALLILSNHQILLTTFFSKIGQKLAAKLHKSNFLSGPASNYDHHELTGLITITYHLFRAGS